MATTLYILCHMAILLYSGYGPHITSHIYKTITDSIISLTSYCYVRNKYAYQIAHMSHICKLCIYGRYVHNMCHMSSHCHQSCAQECCTRFRTMRIVTTPSDCKSSILPIRPINQKKPIKWENFLQIPQLLSRRCASMSITFIPK